MPDDETTPPLMPFPPGAELSNGQLLTTMLNAVRIMNQSQTRVLESKIETVRNEVRAVDTRVTNLAAAVKPAIDASTAVKMGSKLWIVLAALGTFALAVTTVIDWIKVHIR